MMNEPRPWHARTLPRVVFYVSAWVAVTLVSASQTMLAYRATGGPVRAGVILKLAFASWYPWALLAPFAILAARRFPLEAGARLRRIPIHLACNAVLAAAAVEGYLLGRQMVGLPTSQSFSVALAGSAQVHLVTYWVVVGVVHAVVYYRQAREREVRAAELTAQLAAARLDALRMQLHPHFLFNTMHAVASLVREAPAIAEDMLAEFAELLRALLDDPPAHETSLRDELTFIDRYIAIQQVRFGDRLTVRRAVDAGVLDAYVPSLVLQPIVENAIEHGIARQRRGGVVELTAERRRDALVLRVTNDGPAPDSGKPARGVGLDNTRSRLAQLYGDAAMLVFEESPAGGACVTITIPYRTEPQDSPGRAASPDDGRRAANGALTRDR